MAVITFEKYPNPDWEHGYEWILKTLKWIRLITTETWSFKFTKYYQLFQHFVTVQQGGHWMLA